MWFMQTPLNIESRTIPANEMIFWYMTMGLSAYWPFGAGQRDGIQSRWWWTGPWPAHIGTSRLGCKITQLSTLPSTLPLTLLDSVHYIAPSAGRLFQRSQGPRFAAPGARRDGADCKHGPLKSRNSPLVASKRQMPHCIYFTNQYTDIWSPNWMQRHSPLWLLENCPYLREKWEAPLTVNKNLAEQWKDLLPVYLHSQSN